MKQPPTKSAQVRNAIRGLKNSVFTTRDVVNHSPDVSRALIDQIVSRMVRAGKLERIGRGLFSRPKKHPDLGPLPPRSEDIKTAVERTIGMAVIPSGALALNLLGISQQVPSKLEYKTVGPSRTLRIGNREIYLRHAPARRFRAKDPLIGLVVEALSTLGRNGVTANTIDTIRAATNDLQRASLRAHIGDVPIWMQPYIRKITDS